MDYSTRNNDRTSVKQVFFACTDTCTSVSTTKNLAARTPADACTCYNEGQGHCERLKGGCGGRGGEGGGLEQLPLITMRWMWAGSFFVVAAVFAVVVTAVVSVTFGGAAFAGFGLDRSAG